MGEWRSATLGDVVTASGGTVQTGPFGSQLHASDYVDEGVPTVMPANIGENLILEDEIARIRESDAERLAKHRLSPGDIVYSRRGDVGRRALIRESNAGWLCGTGCLRVHFGDEPSVDPAFISYELGAPWVREWIEQHAVGATMLNLNTKILSDVPLDLPPLQLQQAIVEVLGALDDKIAVNERVVRISDELCDAELASVRTASDVECTLRDVLSLNYGKSLPASRRVAGEVAVYGSGGKSGDHDQALVDRPGVVVGRKGTVGTVYWADGPHYPIDTTYFVEPVGKLSSEILYYLLRRMSLSELNSDSAVPGLNRDEAYAQRVRVPGSELAARLTGRLRARFEYMRSLRAESRTLAAIRDELLPLLMSGRLRVADVEKVVSDAT